MKVDQLTLDEMNKVTVLLMQALWGAISPNFRMVAIFFNAPIWKLRFALEVDSDVDREEVEDVAGEFETLLLDLDGGDFKFEVETMVGAEPLPLLDHSLWRVVFLRREGH
jgi:hypothetical protein